MPPQQTEDLLLGRYSIERILGEGYFGRVFLARDTWLKRPVAIKELKEEWLASTAILKRFSDDALIAASLGHPNIVTVHDLQPPLRPQFIIMEYMSGGTLKCNLKKQSRFPVVEAVNVAISISEGLKAAHDKGIVHRDVKPDNILLNEQRIVKLADFGIAHLPEKYGGLDKTWLEHQHPRTPIYASPEQVRGGRLDGRSDLYSVGVVLYELLTGSFYFDREDYRNTSAVDEAVLHHIPEAPSRLNPDIPSNLDKIVMRLLEKEPGNRYADAGELIQDLDKFSLRARPIPGLARAYITSVVSSAHREPTGIRFRIRIEAENSGDKVACWSGLTINLPCISSQASAAECDLTVSSSRKGEPILRAPGETLHGFREDGSFGEMTATCQLVESPMGSWQSGERLSLEASFLIPAGHIEAHVRAWATWEGAGKGRTFTEVDRVQTTNGDPDWAHQGVRDQQGLPAHRVVISLLPHER